MVRYENRRGVQTITERCDDCKCHVRDLTMDDILVKANTDLIIKNSQGEVLTNTSPRGECKCENCS